MSKKPYRLLASLLLMLVATLTSCEKFSIDETTGKSREANANVTIHVQKVETSTGVGWQQDCYLEGLPEPGG